MTLDQQIQIWGVIGTWLASIGTLLAVCVALYLARRSEHPRLSITVGLRDLLIGDGSPIQKHLCFSITNLGERPVTINSIGWSIGKGKNRRLAVQPVHAVCTDSYPKELAYGQNANFMVSFVIVPHWLTTFGSGFVKDFSDRNLNTLVALVQTSIGKSFEIRPEKGLLKALKEVETE